MHYILGLHVYIIILFCHRTVCLAATLPRSRATQPLNHFDPKVFSLLVELDLPQMHTSAQQNYLTLAPSNLKWDIVATIHLTFLLGFYSGDCTHL